MQADLVDSGVFSAPLPYPLGAWPACPVWSGEVADDRILTSDQVLKGKHDVSFHMQKGDTPTEGRGT